MAIVHTTGWHIAPHTCPVRLAMAERSFFAIQTQAAIATVIFTSHIVVTIRARLAVYSGPWIRAAVKFHDYNLQVTKLYDRAGWGGRGLYLPAIRSATDFVACAAISALAMLATSISAFQRRIDEIAETICFAFSASTIA